MIRLQFHWWKWRELFLKLRSFGLFSSCLYKYPFNTFTSLFTTFHDNYITTFYKRQNADRRKDYSIENGIMLEYEHHISLQIAFLFPISRKCYRVSFGILFSQDSHNNGCSMLGWLNAALGCESGNVVFGFYAEYNKFIMKLMNTSDVCFLDPFSDLVYLLLFVGKSLKYLFVNLNKCKSWNTMGDVRLSEKNAILCRMMPKY